MKRLQNVHPGKVLVEDFLKPLGISQVKLGKAIGKSENTINDLCAGKSGISHDMAIRLAKYFGTSIELWHGLQSDYEREKLYRRYGRKYNSIKPFKRKKR